jgi:hypothetical protein
MTLGNTPFRYPPEKNPADVLQKLVSVFARKGWLNQTLRIKHHGRKYRICCSEKEFFAYRINDYCGISPGFPGWPVCMVTHHQIIEDSDMSPFASTEPTTHDWLRCITEHDFELI